jgi:hypothetical protein
MASQQEASGVRKEQEANHGVRQPKWFSSGTTIKAKLQSSSYTCPKLPRLLYRVSSNKSMGINTKDGFESALCKLKGGNLAFDEQDYQDVASWIISHNDNAKNIQKPSPFISFSRSLLTTLQRAEWMKKQRHDDICIAVVDTKCLNETDLVMYLPKLLEAFDLVEGRPYILDDSRDEFVAWYRLDLRTPGNQYSTLGTEGLYRLIPELKNHGAALGACLADLRAVLFNRNGCSPTTSLNAQQRLEVSSRLSHLLYPQSFDTLVAFLYIRAQSTPREGEALRVHMEKLIKGAIDNRYFGKDRSVNYQDARYYSWLETDPPVFGNEEVILYNSMHRELVHVARKHEAQKALEAADCVKGMVPSFLKVYCGIILRIV